MPINRTAFNALVNDTGGGTDGSIVNKAMIAATILDPIDAALLAVPIEGVWTPVISGAGGQSGQAYSVQVGAYVKIGRLVIATCFANLSAKGTITGALSISGLPFPADAASNVLWMGTVEFVLATNWISIVGRVSQGGSAILLEGVQAAATSNLNQLSTADLNDSSRFIVTIAYRAAT